MNLKNFEVVESETDDEDLSDLKIRIGIFTCFWASGMFGNLDTGVIPTTLHLIEDDLGITQGEAAFLGSISYLATGVGSLLVAPIFSCFKVKYVLVVAHIFNASSTLFFLYSDKYWLLLGARVV